MHPESPARSTASVTSRTAVYGPVRTVVWQGTAGDCRPYADQTPQAPGIGYAWMEGEPGRTPPFGSMSGLPVRIGHCARDERNRVRDPTRMLSTGKDGA